MTQAPEKQLIAVDMVVTRFHPRNDKFQILLIRRGNEPFKGKYALPGGFVESDETVERAASRELLEETGLTVAPGKWRLKGVYSEPERDPRGRVISLSMLAHIYGDTEPKAGDDAAGAEFVDVHGDLSEADLAFDHAKIIRDAGL